MLRFSSSDPDWCTRCNITIMVDVEEAGKYYIMARTNDISPKLHDGKKVDDALHVGEEICYGYYVHEENTNVEFKL